MGCPFDCIFCNQKKISSTISAPGPADIKEIVDKHLNTIPSDSHIEIAFFGGSFTAIDKELQIEYLAAVQPYLKNGQVDSIRLSTRPDFIDSHILELLSEYGVKTIELGVQSLNDEVLKKSCRVYNVDDVFKASHLIKSFDIKLGIQLMIGLPGDKYEYDMDTAKKTISLKPDMVRIYPTLVIKDTALEVLYEKGWYSPLSLDEAVNTTKEMYLYFIANDIDVIRMGLYPSEELRSSDTVVAGPFHPAFGELVEQEVFYDQVNYLLKLVNKEDGWGNSLFI
ncbi:MAG: radical SAM protein, partial [Syntrophomonadaceae bacterium]|nr:radical SAM protein [Syntrophomonadaceae bacterium]